MAETHHDHAALMPPSPVPVVGAGSPRPKEATRTTGALVALLALRLILALAFSLATPLGEAPDEADHYAYAAYIMSEGKLPVGPEMTQGKHPPLYHILAAAAGKLAGGSPDRSFLRANPDMAFGPQSQATNFFIHTTLEEWPWRDGVLAMRAGRFVSIIAGLVLVLATFLLGRAIWPARPELVLAGAAFAAFLPESLFVGGAMSNDMLAAMWATLAMCSALWQTRPALKPPNTSATPREWGVPVTSHPRCRYAALNSVLAGLCLGLAFVTKASTGSLAVIVAAALFVSRGCFVARAWPKGISRWPEARMPGVVAVALAGIAAFLIAAPWLWRNWRLYGDPFGWPMVLATIDQRQGALTLADIAQLLRGWWLSFWGKFGGAGHIPLPTAYYVIWAVIGLAALAGWVLWLVRGRRSKGLVSETPRVAWIALVGAPLVTAAGIYSYSQVALGADQGRLLFPALGPIALLIAGGLGAWLPRRAARLGSGVFAGGMALVAIAALYVGLVQPFAPPPEPKQERSVAAQAMNGVFGPLELVATAWDDPAPGQLTLYWRAAAGPAPDDLRTAVQLLDANGNLLWEWKRSPGAGRFSTDRWPQGRVVADVYRPPQDVLAKATAVQVGLRPFPEGVWLAPQGGNGEMLSLPLPARQGQP